MNSNSACQNLLQVKLTCKNSCFADYHTHLTLAALIEQMI